MVLEPEETERFYRVWFALLHYVNEQRHLLPSFPESPTGQAVPLPDVLQLRDALWADDALRERFVAQNPSGLPAADLELVASWRYRVAGSFFVERHLKKYSVFLSEDTPAHAYGELGLVSPIEDIVGPYLPVYVKAVLLPFEGRIIYDSLIIPYAVTFGSGMRASIRDAYRDAQEREGIITTLVPPEEPADPAAVRAAMRARMAKVLAAFRKDLARAGLLPRTVEQHMTAVASFQDYLLEQEPPRSLLDLTLDDLDAYLTAPRHAAHRVSLRRLVRFLRDTGRLDYGGATEEVEDYLRHVPIE